ncbi:MAG TPA: hypothetical protein PLZ43_11630 [bacterium]|nr:hypothetical protein [bacterium]
MPGREVETKCLAPEDHEITVLNLDSWINCADSVGTTANAGFIDLYYLESFLKRGGDI